MKDWYDLAQRLDQANAFSTRELDADIMELLGWEVVRNDPARKISWMMRQTHGSGHWQAIPRLTVCDEQALRNMIFERFPDATLEVIVSRKRAHAHIWINGHTNSGHACTPALAIAATFVRAVGKRMDEEAA